MACTPVGDTITMSAQILLDKLFEKKLGMSGEKEAIKKITLYGR